LGVSKNDKGFLKTGRDYLKTGRGFFGGSKLKN
jgi:hypothetical protein